MTWNLASGLEGKRVLVTGGAGGIGREVALAFGAAGSRVAVVDLAEDKVRAVVAEMEGGPHLPLAADLRPVAGHPKLVETVVGALGGLDVLVCAAAVLVRRASVDEVSEADWDFQHDINLKSTFFLNQAAFMLLMTWVNTIAYFCQTDLVARSYSSIADRARAIADIDLVVNACTAAILLQSTL